MKELQEKAEIYATEKMNELITKAIAQAYIDGYQNGYNDRDSESVKLDHIEGEICVCNLGLPSGTMWTPDYLKDKYGDTNYLPYVKASKLGLPSKE